MLFAHLRHCDTRYCIKEFIGLSLEVQLEPQTDRVDGSPSMPAVAPHPRLRLHRAFHSRFLHDDRDIIVYLPPGYEEEPERLYPVFYMHDGQNLFDPATAFAGRTWEVREHADAAIEAGEVEPLI